MDKAPHPDRSTTVSLTRALPLTATAGYYSTSADSKDVRGWSVSGDIVQATGVRKMNTLPHADPRAVSGVHCGFASVRLVTEGSLFHEKDVQRITLDTDGAPAAYRSEKDEAYLSNTLHQVDPSPQYNHC